MKKYLPIMVVLLTAASLSGCRKGVEHAWLDEAEAFVATVKPDSADERLGRIDIGKLRGGDRARYALLRTLTDDKLGREPESDSLICAAYDYYDRKSKHGESGSPETVRRFAQAVMFMGDRYARQDSTSRCEQAYRTAVKWAEQAGDPNTQYCALMRLAKQKYRGGNTEEALRLVYEARDVYQACSNDEEYFYLHIIYDAATYFIHTADETHHNYNTAFCLIDMVYKYARRSGSQRGLNLCHVADADIYSHIGMHDKALKSARQIVFDHEETEAGIGQRFVVAECYRRCDSVRQAVDLYRCCLRSTDAKMRYLASRRLGDLMVRDGQPDSAAAYYKAALDNEEEVNRTALATKEDYYREVVSQERERERMRYEASLQTRVLGGGIAFFALLALFVGVGLSLRLRVQRERRRSQLKARKHELERHILERCHLESERRILAEKVGQKEAMVRFLRGYIIERLEFVRKVSGEKSSRITLTRKDWYDIERIVDEIDDHSISRVRERFPGLSEEDIRLCIMVRLRLSNPVIGSIYGISVSAVQHRKQKLKKEGLGETDPGTTLEQAIGAL